MPAKFRLSVHQKYECRKKRARKVAALQSMQVLGWVDVSKEVDIEELCYANRMKDIHTLNVD